MNNAGLALGRDYFEEADMDDWETMIDTNVKGLLYVTRGSDTLYDSDRKAILSILDRWPGKEMYEKGNVYCATKYAVDAISQKSMRIDLLSHRIKVTTIDPVLRKPNFRWYDLRVTKKRQFNL